MATYCLTCEVRVVGSVVVEADSEAEARKKTEDSAPIEEFLKLMPVYDSVNIEVEHCEEVPMGPSQPYSMETKG